MLTVSRVCERLHLPPSVVMEEDPDYLRFLIAIWRGENIAAEEEKDSPSKKISGKSRRRRRRRR
jgi:hypothetical protein